MALITRCGDRVAAMAAAATVLMAGAPSAFAAGIIASRELRLGLPWGPANEQAASAVTAVDAVTDAVHDRGMALAQRHALSLYDAMIVAAALEAGAGTLYSENMQHGLRVERSMKIVNPFSP